MTKYEAINTIHRCGLDEDDIYSLVKYMGKHIRLDKRMKLDNIKAIIEAISNGECTIKLSERSWGRTYIDVVYTKSYYSEYWD